MKYECAIVFLYLLVKGNMAMDNKTIPAIKNRDYFRIFRIRRHILDINIINIIKW